MAIQTRQPKLIWYDVLINVLSRLVALNFVFATFEAHTPVNNSFCT